MKQQAVTEKVQNNSTIEVLSQYVKRSNIFVRQQQVIVDADIAEHCLKRLQKKDYAYV